MPFGLNKFRCKMHALVYGFRTHFTPDRNLQQYFSISVPFVFGEHQLTIGNLGQGKWFAISTECALRCTHKNPNNDNNREKLI